MVDNDRFDYRLAIPEQGIVSDDGQAVDGIEDKQRMKKTTHDIRFCLKGVHRKEGQAERKWRQNTGKGCAGPFSSGASVTDPSAGR